jgi:hypothetical protein
MEKLTRTPSKAGPGGTIVDTRPPDCTSSDYNSAFTKSGAITIGANGSESSAVNFPMSLAKN